MTKSQIIEALYTGKNFNDCISKMYPSHLREDLKAEVIMEVCEWPDEKVIKLHETGRLEFYVVRVIINMLSNKYGPFYKKFRMVYDRYIELSQAGSFGGRGDGNNEHRHNHHIADNLNAAIAASHPEEFEERQTREDMEDRTLGKIDELYWYNAEMIRLYVKHGNYRAIERETGIPYISCYKSIQKSFKELKKNVV